MMKPACPLPSSTTDKSERARERHRETETHRRGGNQFKVATHTHLNKIKNKPIYKMWQIFAMENKTQSQVPGKFPCSTELYWAKLPYFFLLPHFLMCAIPVLQLCEFYDDTKSRGWGHFVVVVPNSTYK